MHIQHIALAFGLLFQGTVLGATYSSSSGTFSFTTPEGWSQDKIKGQPTFPVSEDGYFSINGPGGVSLINLELPEAANSEPLAEVEQKASYFHSMTFPVQLISGPEKVTGPGWEGLIRRETNGLGQYELQLVAKHQSRSLLFYLTAPGNISDSQKKELEKILLSLQFKQISHEG